jgi:superfamily II DNA or RNA helicase
MPYGLSIPEMKVDREPAWLKTWTVQPGTDGTLHIVTAAATGFRASDLPMAAQTAAAQVVDVPMASSGAGRVVQMRDYQNATIDGIRAAWEKGAKAPMIVLGTGAGKTLIAAELMSRIHQDSGAKCLFLAQREELLEQTIQKIRLVSPMTRVGLVQGKSDELGREITVASVQTLAHKDKKRLSALIASGPYKLLIVDECHHATTPSHEKVIDALREANPGLLICGMTATPGREDGVALDRIFDVIAYEKNTIDLIRDGWLVPPKIFSQEIDVDFANVGTSGGDFVVTQLSKLMNTPHVRRAVVDAWRTKGQDRKSLVFSCDVEHAKALAQDFNDAGHPAASVDGKMKKSERRQVLSDFRTGKIKLLCSCVILTEGYDDPSAEGLVFARPTHSQTLAIQMLGRGLRLFPGKTECVVVDCVGNSEKHRPVQLATLVGFDPEKKFARSAGLGKEEEEEGLGEEEMVIEITDARLGKVGEIEFTARTARTILKSVYQWRETGLGWILQVPRIGYYLVAWSDKNKLLATIRFFDQRAGRKHQPPVEMVRQPVEFDMAYGLVEGEMDRIFRAHASRREDVPADEDLAPAVSFVDLDEGTDEAITVNEDWMLKESLWREKNITEAQRALLVKIGVKAKTMPTLAGEASDLITIIRAERDMKMRLPATAKQIAYLRVKGFPFDETTTKGQAASFIWRHRQETGR